MKNLQIFILQVVSQPSNGLATGSVKSPNALTTKILHFFIMESLKKPTICFAWGEQRYVVWHGIWCV